MKARGGLYIYSTGESVMQASGLSFGKGGDVTMWAKKPAKKPAKPGPRR